MEPERRDLEALLRRAQQVMDRQEEIRRQLHACPGICWAFHIQRHRRMVQHLEASQRRAQDLHDEVMEALDERSRLLLMRGLLSVSKIQERDPPPPP